MAVRTPSWTLMDHEGFAIMFAHTPSFAVIPGSAADGVARRLAEDIVAWESGGDGPAEPAVVGREILIS